MREEDRTHAERLRAAYAKDMLAMVGCLGAVLGMFVLCVLVGALL